MEENQQIEKKGFFWQKISKRTYTMAECLTPQEIIDIPIPENTVKDCKNDQAEPSTGAVQADSAENISPAEMKTIPAVAFKIPKITNKDNINNAKVTDDPKKKTKVNDKPITFGQTMPISIQQISKIANQSSKRGKKTGNSSFMFLTAGANSLLTKTGTNPKIKKNTKSNSALEESKQNAASQPDISNDPAVKSKEVDLTSDVEMLDVSENSVVESATVGNVKDIPQRDLLHISKQSSNIKKKAQAVDSDFLLLNTCANALLPEKGEKKKSKPKVSSQPSTAEAKSNNENENGKRPHSPEDTYFDDRRYRPRNRNYDDEDDYFCRVCDVDLNSEQTWIAHIEGKKHQKKLAFYQPPSNYYGSDDMQYVKRKDGCRINRREKPDAVPKIKDQIEILDDPCLGLNFVSEIWRIHETEETYFCSLCSMTCYGITIINHIIGCKHRLAYMKLFDPTNHDKVKASTTKKSQLTAELHKYAVPLVEKHGSGKMKVEIEVEGYVAPLESGKIYRDRGGNEVSSSALPIEANDLLAMPPHVKIRYIEETGACCDVTEIVTSEQFNAIVRAVENLKKALSEYTPGDLMLNRRLTRFLQAESAYKMDVPPTSVKTERFAPMQGYPSSYNLGFQASSRVLPVGYEAEHFGQMPGPSNYYTAQRNASMNSFSTYLDSGRRWQTPPMYEARDQNHPMAAAAFDAERHEQMRASHYPMDPPGTSAVPKSSSFASGPISQMYIPPYPFATERHEQPSATQLPFKPQPSSTGRGVWGPFQ